MINLKEELQSLLKGEIVDDEATLVRYSRDASIFEVKPRLIVFPKDVEDIKKLVLFVNEKRAQGLSLTCRAGGSDMTGGPLSESIVLDMTRYLNRIKEIGEDFATVEPGVFYRDFEKETIKRNLLLPCFPASKELCTLGGMVANNAGGEKTLAYGKTDHYVQELKVVLADGNEYVFKKLSREELAAKLSFSSFEGEFYRRVFAMVQENEELLKAAKPKVSKNSAGYALWNVWDKEKGMFDMTQLFVGSQGTLGIITEIRFKLVAQATHSSLLVVFLKDQSLLAEVTEAILREKPESFELYDDHTLKLAARFFLDFVKTLKGNVFSLGLRFLPEFLMLLKGGVPKLILLAEFSGETHDGVLKKAKNAKENIKMFKVETWIAKNEGEIEKYHAIRRESFNLLRGHVRGMTAVPFIDDIIVRSEDLEVFLPKLTAILSEYPQLIYTIAGHVGDGNLHIIPLMDLKRPDASKVIMELSQRVYDLVFSFKGSMTAEHNDGIIRTPFLEQMYGSKVVELFLQAKRIFDPANIFNPGKKVSGTKEYLLSHIAKE